MEAKIEFYRVAVKSLPIFILESISFIGVQQNYKQHTSTGIYTIYET